MRAPTLLLPLALTLIAPLQAWSKSPQEAKVHDQPLDEYRVLLLDQAFQAASAMPLHPLIKDRSRAQEKVVVAALEVEQPVRALRYTEGIENWRRGIGYADYASYCAEQGFHAEVEPYLEEALEVAAGPTGEAEQEWRRDRILAKVASVRFQLGQDELALSIGTDIEGSEARHVQAAAARFGSIEDFEGEIRALREVARVGGFERKQIGLRACTELYDRFYDDAKRRAKVMITIEDLEQKLPVQVRIETRIRLAHLALDREDHAQALGFLGTGQALYDSVPWNAESGVPWLGRLATAFARAGDVEGAKERVQRALGTFEKETETILSIDRADALLPLAEALFEAGDREGSLALYRRSLEWGADNPNARPRADDLVALCCSLARHGCEPDEALSERIAEVLVGLESPW